MIATRLHKLIEMIGAEADPFCGHQHYVIDRSLVDMMERTDVRESIQAMIDAGVARLPYASVLIEYMVINETRRFVRLLEVGGRIEGMAAALIRDTVATVSERPMTVQVSGGAIEVDLAGGNKLDAAAIGIATAMALLLLNTRGVTKDVIEPHRLNKARMASNKPAIPRHSVLRIGTVYDRDGRELRGDGQRRSPIVHLRAGHTRNQACGPDMADRRVIYIPPVLVNFAGQMPEPRVRVVAR